MGKNNLMNLLKSGIHFILKSVILRLRFYLRDKKTGLSLDEYCNYKLGINDLNIEFGISVFRGKSICRTSRFWYAQCVMELFSDQVYKFEARSSQPRIIDCGCNIGLSIIYFKTIYPESIITAFEPDPKIFDLCKKNLLEFKIQDVEVINAALWNKIGTLNFLSDNSLGGRIFDSEYLNPNNLLPVKSICLSSFLQEPIDFLKIDIEGAELIVLQECELYLSNVNLLFIEYHSHHDQRQSLSDILTIVKNSGFRYYLREAWENMKLPFIDNKCVSSSFDLQLNIFCFRN